MFSCGPPDSYLRRKYIPIAAKVITNLNATRPLDGTETKQNLRESGLTYTQVMAQTPSGQQF